MITFLEYSYNLEQISHMFKSIAQDPSVKLEDMTKWIINSVPPEYIDKLPEGSRADAALLLLKILINQPEDWNKLGKFVEPLWDQSISGPGKTLGKELLNNISSLIMDKVGADFFISYSGEIPRSAVYKYTKKHVRVFASKSNYRWGELKKVHNTITSDYTSQFNNYRQLQSKR